ncbi:hypothetical protein HMPREF0322_04311 [Desulfitobacterium hafniense DP7]|uniref:Uncharacterized protein n=1 Tax=Desulfitobacterium hafniense DP7 TaxID=537010 RepID=G9XTK4_DESHA|nr:hypothetical protein HMPREF0322_04311 [Desulfitobacterium hafniense DP7]
MIVYSEAWGKGECIKLLIAFKNFIYGESWHRNCNKTRIRLY